MQKPQKIMIVRHAEKPDNHGKNPVFGIRKNGSKDDESLTVRGWQRAGALSVLFGNAAVARERGLAVPEYLFAADPEKADKEGSKSRRPKQTLEPLSEVLGIPIFTGWTKGQEEEIAHEAVSRRGTVLISWQHELIPSIASKIPGGDIAQTKIWPDDRFDFIWVFDARADGTYKFHAVRQAVLSGDLPMQKS